MAPRPLRTGRALFRVLQTGCATTSFRRAATIEDPQTKWSVKIDHVFNDKHRIGFFTNRTKYNQNVGADGPPGLPLPLYDGSVQEFNTEAYRGTYDWTLVSADAEPSFRGRKQV